MMRCMILMIVTIGLNMLIGHAGLVSLGQAALYGLGAYMAAWLAVKQGVSVPAGGRGRHRRHRARRRHPRLSDGASARRLSRRHHHRVRAGVPEHSGRMAGGHGRHAGTDRHPARQGFRRRADPADLFLGRGRLPDRRVRLQYNLIHSRYGRAMRATAQSENAARALGINLAATRTLAFVISAALAVWPAASTRSSTCS